MDILEKIASFLKEDRDEEFGIDLSKWQHPSEGDYVNYKGEKYQVSHKEAGMIEIVSSDEKVRIKVSPAEVTKWVDN